MDLNRIFTSRKAEDERMMMVVGAGYSDDASVVSDISTPTVVSASCVPEEEDYKECSHPTKSKGRLSNFFQINGKRTSGSGRMLYMGVKANVSIPQGGPGRRRGRFAQKPRQPSIEEGNEECSRRRSSDSRWEEPQLDVTSIGSKEPSSIRSKHTPQNSPSHGRATPSSTRSFESKNTFKWNRSKSNDALVVSEVGYRNSPFERSRSFENPEDLHMQKDSSLNWDELKSTKLRRKSLKRSSNNQYEEHPPKVKHSESMDIKDMPWNRSTGPAIKAWEIPDNSLLTSMTSLTIGTNAADP